MRKILIHLNNIISPFFKGISQSIYTCCTPSPSFFSVKKVHPFHRKKRRGRGTAGIDGLRYALEKGADYIIEMDADFSHNPKYIPEILKAMEKYDVAIGSRFIDGGKDKDR